jgi:hypothetical protein
VSAAVNDCKVKGLQDFNLKLVCPMEVDGYTVGFKYTVDESIKKAPDSLFVRKSFPTPANGAVTIDAEYDVNNKVIIKNYVIFVDYNLNS